MLEEYTYFYQIPIRYLSDTDLDRYPIFIRYLPKNPSIGF